MADLIEKYLGEAFGRGMLRPMHTRNVKKLEKILKKAKIKYAVQNGVVYVGDDDEDEVEELMARNLLF